MRVDCALLSDSVKVRDGLLFILGGGITRITRTEYPAPLGASLAIRVMLHPTETDRGHQLEARLQDADGQEIGKAEVSFAVEESTEALPGEEVSALFPLPLDGAPIPAPGSYSFEILIDGVHQQSVPFVAKEVPSGT